MSFDLQHKFGFICLYSLISCVLGLSFNFKFWFLANDSTIDMCQGSLLSNFKHTHTHTHTHIRVVFRIAHNNKIIYTTIEGLQDRSSIDSEKEIYQHP